MSRERLVFRLVSVSCHSLAAANIRAGWPSRNAPHRSISQPYLVQRSNLSNRLFLTGAAPKNPATYPSVLRFDPYRAALLRRSASASDTAPNGSSAVRRTISPEFLNLPPHRESPGGASPLPAPFSLVVGLYRLSSRDDSSVPKKKRAGG